MTENRARAFFTAPSIAVRLAVSALLASSLILVIAGAILSRLYRESVERAFDNRLLVYATDLATDIVSPGEAEQRVPGTLGDPRFDLPLSGWYWQVGRADARPRDIRSSRSLVGATLNGPVSVLEGSSAQIRKGYVQAPDERWLRIVEREVDVGEEGRYIVRVAGPADEIEGDVRQFVIALTVTFLLLGLSLGLTTLLQIRFGLAPLVMLRGAVSGIRRGEAERIAGRYPPDIAPLAGEINLLLDTNRGILERARTQVGNLAHALKTPLSVIVNEVDGGAPEPVSTRIREQAAIMRDQVDYHLKRARAAALAGSLGTLTDVEPAVAALVRTFAKIYRDKALTIEARVAPGARFRGERQDLEEMIGNLVENACKWTASRVEVAVATAHADNRIRLTVTVEDDGPGLPDDVAAIMLERGRRLDETKPGSGLGLSIVADLAALYGGSVRLQRSEGLGGLAAVLDLPGDG